MKGQTVSAWGCAAAMMGAAWCAPHADAAIVRVGSEVVFDSGGYEGETVGELPASPVVGSYNFHDEFTGFGPQILTGATDDGPPAAGAGANYLTIDRTAQGANANSWVNGIFSRSIDTATESFTVEYLLWGENLHMAFAVGNDEADGTSASQPGVLNAWGYHEGVASIVEFRSTGTTAIPLTWNTGAWNTVIYVWDASEQEASLTINGNTVTLASGRSVPATVSQFHARANGGGTALYMDAVPEPATAGLFAGGLLLSLRRCRRRHRPVADAVPVASPHIRV